MPTPSEENTRVLDLDDEDPILDGDIAEFMAANAVPDKKYAVMLKKRAPDSARIQSLTSYRNRIPTVEEIGQQFGPGLYKLTFTWTVKGAPTGAKTRAEDYDMDLPEDPWRRLHIKWKREDLDRQEAEDKDRLRTKQESAHLEALAAGRGLAPASGVEDLKTMAQTLRDIGIPVGGNVGGGLTIEKALGYITLLAPVLTPLLQGIFQRDNSAKEMNTLLLQMLVKQAPGDDKMGKLMDTLFQTTERALRLGGPSEPKEDIVDKIFGLLESFGPAFIAGLAAKTPEQRKRDPIFNAAVKSPEMQAVKEDPALLEALVNKFDEAYGYQQTDKVMLAPFADIGITRPASTYGNKEKFPSPGFDTAGNKLNSDA